MAIATEYDLRWVDTGSLSPNPWNPNVMSPEMYEKEMASIREFGFVDPITVRPLPNNGYEIIDGENRWKAATDLGHKKVPIVDLGVISDAVAQQLTVVLNETRGRPDHAKLGELLATLRAEAHLSDLLRVLPFTEQEFGRLTNFQQMKFPDPPEVPVQLPDKAVRWVERIYRMPPDAATVIDDAVARFTEQNGPTPEWRVFELLCADYLGKA